MREADNIIPFPSKQERERKQLISNGDDLLTAVFIKNFQHVAVPPPLRSDSDGPKIHFDRKLKKFLLGVPYEITDGPHTTD